MSSSNRSLGRIPVLGRRERDRGFWTMLHGFKRVLAVCARFKSKSKRVEPEEQRQGQDHQFGVEQDEDAGVVETPAAPEAASRFGHRPGCSKNGEDLPARGMQGFEFGKAGEAQAGSEGTEGEQDAAEERPLAKAKNGRAKNR